MKTGGPRFKDVPSAASGKFSWNPCFSFEQPKMCTQCSACQNQDNKKYYKLGTQDSAFFNVTDGVLKVWYSAKVSGQIERHAVVTLICDKTAEADFTVQGEKGTGFYYMTLKSKHCCASSGVGLSIGSILCIVALMVVILYVIGGIVYQKFARKAEGREMMPNYTFWTGLPGHIRDGVLFIARAGRSERKYNQI